LHSTSGLLGNTIAFKIRLDIISPAPFPALNFFNKKINLYIYNIPATSTTVKRVMTQRFVTINNSIFQIQKHCTHTYLLIICSNAPACVCECAYSDFVYEKSNCSFSLSIQISDPNHFVNI